jgi:hypothetical protein
MAVKAVCAMNGRVGRYFSDHTKCYVGVNYVVLDDSEPPIEGTLYIYNLDPSDLQLLLGAVQSQVKTFLTAQGVVFGLLDTVQFLSSSSAG